MKKLYIIGNGFDRYHGLPTSYECFSYFMFREYPKVHDRVGRIFDINDPNMLWLNFEEKLGELDVLGMVNRNLSWWVDTEKQKDFTNPFDTLYEDLVDCFHEWVIQVNKFCTNSKRIELDKNAYFISFNYTNTLQRLYGIKEEQICYIHGNTGNNELRRPIVGHGNNEYETLINEEEIRNIIEGYQQRPKWAESIDFTEEVVKEIKNLLGGLKKKPTDNIRNEKSFFDKYVSLNEIYVLGHSLADVDLPYFEKIARESSEAKWYVSYRDDDLKDLKRIAENTCKIPFANDVKLITLDELKVIS